MLFFLIGKLIRKCYGGGYFSLPLIDQIFVLALTIQQSSFQPTSRSTVVVMWRIEDPETAFQQLGNQVIGDHAVLVVGTVESLLAVEINKRMRDLRRNEDLSAWEQQLMEYLHHQFNRWGILIEAPGIET